MPPALKASFTQPSFIVAMSVVVALFAVAIAYVYTIPKTSGSYVSPVRADIVQEVDSAGTVAAADQVDLSFQTSGRIAHISAKVGSHVAAGTTLASEDASDMRAALSQAQAALQVQQVKLDALKAGARPESIAVSQTAVTGTQSSLAQATQNLLAAAQSAYSTADDAVRSKTDQFINNPRTAFLTLVFTLSNSQLQSSLLADRVAMETTLNDWQQALNATPASPTDAQIDSIVQLSKTDAANVRAYLDEAASALTQVVPTTQYPTASITALQNTVAAARTSVSSAITTLDSAATARTSAVNALRVAQSALTLAQAPATQQDLEAQQAQVASAQANVDVAQAQLGKAVIRSPFSGIITVNNAHLGQTATPGVPLISMVSDARFQFDTYVSQADLAKLAVGNSAQIIRDAYQDTAPLQAHVVAIDPAATVQNGVSSYKITLEFDTNDQRVLAGLTGNAKIITQRKTQALTVPSSAIITHGNTMFVMKRSSGADTLTPVQVGITSASGTTEIISGISESDSIETFGNAQ